MKVSLRHCHALTVADGAFSHKIDYFTNFMDILNPEGHPNCITGSKVTAILLNVLILPIGGASSGRVCACSLRSRLVFLLYGEAYTHISDFLYQAGIASIDIWLITCLANMTSTYLPYLGF